MAKKTKIRLGSSTFRVAFLGACVSDDCRYILPAAGYRSGSSLNNAGSNGNYWSSSLNSNNSNNAYNMNFNSGNHNWNNNNRNNGFTVRPVLGSVQPSLLFIPSDYTSVCRAFLFHHSFHVFLSFSMSYILTYDQLFHDLHHAYYDARRHKRRKAYQLEFEMRLEQNLKRLCDELWTRTYQPRPSTCFIINDPKKREVFAAQFRDRIVHHLYYNYTHELFVRTFIHDSYSCIRKRGTHFGIHRLNQHIRQESRNYTRPCYVLKMDIKGYFMNIDRSILLNKTP